jgi:hypothetical protein
VLLPGVSPGGHTSSLCPYFGRPSSLFWLTDVPILVDCPSSEATSASATRIPRLRAGLTGLHGLVTMIIRTSPLSNLIYAMHFSFEMTRPRLLLLPSIDPVSIRVSPARSRMEAPFTHFLCVRLCVLRAVVMVKHHHPSRHALTLVAALASKRLLSSSASATSSTFW